MNFSILRAIFKKDLQSLAPIVVLTAVLFFSDALVARLDLLPVWSTYNLPVLLAALVVLLLSVFQLDSAVSLADDWLCRPLRRREMIAAKVLLVLGAVYLPHAAGTFLANASLGLPVTESLLEAVLLQDRVLSFLLPILLFTAIITRTLVQGLGVLFGIFIGVFVVPTPFVRPPGPLTPGLRDELLFSGMEWLATTPARLAALILLAIGFWLVYWRRRIVAARWLMALTVCVTLFFMLLPMVLMSWTATFALQKAFGPADSAHTRVTLHNPRVCFPATRRAELATDAEFVAATHGSNVRLWAEEELRDAGPDSVAFLSTIEPRGLPLDWRVKLNYVKAEYSAAGQVLYSLRPARYYVDRVGGGALAHAWMLPERAAQRLQTARPQLELTYSLTLLSPREYRLPTDGKRHALPGLGHCTARVDEPGNRIEVDCFSAFTWSAQISAELNEIPASRAHAPADLAPWWTRLPYSQRVTLEIGSPRLAAHDSITVTAWDVAGYLDRSLTLPGILGADLTTCPLPTVESNEFLRRRWRDTAPHEVHQISVDEGVQLEVLDFGGDGVPAVLLPGLGATAHSYDDLAPLLARKHRVIALTRRGTGYSSKPDFGFETQRLGQDVLEVMKALELGKVVLVGHSIAGDELTWLGGHHPDRFYGLVYLDAAYDRSGDGKTPAAARLRELNRALPPEPPIAPQALQNYEAMSKSLAERGHLRPTEGELIAFLSVDSPFVAGTPSIDARTQQAIRAAIQAPDYRRLTIPALAIYALSDPDAPLPPWYDLDDKELVANVAEIARLRAAMQRASIELFRNNVAKGRILEMRNAEHYIIQSNPREVLEAIENFVADLDPDE